MASGKLVKMLLKTQVSHYLRWKAVDATYVYQYSKGGMFSSPSHKVEKVPSSESEAIKSKLMGMMEKMRCKKFFIYVSDVEPENTKTWGKYDLMKMKFGDLAKKFSLS